MMEEDNPICAKCRYNMICAANEDCRLHLLMNPKMKHTYGSI